ncbi:hypothetical protein [Actinokineospora inagensis]|uniref:hypothetical protein n=1 Tax=Actinokineospora inagensis TaxID=103730 RepID=UPI000400BF05|nr:hypothetical protein [Actinokineospora inagensis]
MSQPILAEQVVDILAGLVTNRISGPRRRPADALFDAVVGRLRRIRRASAFDLFEADPHGPRQRRALVDLLAAEFADDPTFREGLAELVRSTGGSPDGTPAPPDPKPQRRILFGAGAAVLVLVLAFGGRAIYLRMTEKPPLDGSTPCHTFWALTDTEQRDLMVRAYQNHGQHHRSDEPYIVASVLYACGQNPESTVDQIIDAAARP